MADPRIVKRPLSVPVIIYKSRELALRGAEVLHEDAVRPEPVWNSINIKSTLEPEKTWHSHGRC